MNKILEIIEPQDYYTGRNEDLNEVLYFLPKEAYRALNCADVKLIIITENEAIFFKREDLSQGGDVVLETDGDDLRRLIGETLVGIEKKGGNALTFFDIKTQESGVQTIRFCGFEDNIYGFSAIFPIRFEFTAEQYAQWRIRRATREERFAAQKAESAAKQAKFIAAKAAQKKQEALEKADYQAALKEREERKKAGEKTFFDFVPQTGEEVAAERARLQEAAEKSLCEDAFLIRAGGFFPEHRKFWREFVEKKIS